MRALIIALSTIVITGTAGAAHAGEAQPLALGAKAPLADAKLKNATDGKESPRPGRGQEGDAGRVHLQQLPLRQGVGASGSSSSATPTPRRGSASC